MVAVGLPLAAVALGVIWLAASERTSLAGGIGSVLTLAIVVGVFSLAGEAAAIAALVRDERWAGLSVLGLIINTPAILVAAYLALRMAD